GAEGGRPDGFLAFAIRDHRPRVPSSPGKREPAFRRARLPPTRAPYAGAGSVGALAAPAPTAGAARKLARAERVLRAARHPHGHASGRRYASRQAYRSAARVINHSSADRYAVPVRWVARTAPGDDGHAPWAVERRCKRGRAGSKHRNGEERRQRDGANGMADHGDPRLAAPLGGAWLWPLCLFFIMGRAMVGLARNAVRHG